MKGRKGFQPGQSGNPNGRRPVLKQIQELAQQHSEMAFAKIIELCGSDDEKVALAAAREILDRGYGKPAQAMELSGQGGAPLAAVLQIVQRDKA